jgi:ComF family protein
MTKEEGAAKIFLRSIIKTAKDSVFPVFCLACGREGFLACPDCLQHIERAGRWFCPVCRAPAKQGFCCAPCAPHSFIDAHAAIARYSEQSLIGTLIRYFKYHCIEEISFIFQTFISDFLSDNKDVFRGIDCIVPVPLHKRRYAERGFNQASILAATVASELDVFVDEKSLRRIVYTRHQASLSREDRLHNVRDAFACGSGAASKDILLVDDVFTTGATMQACAKALRAAGARRVTGFSLARG